MTLARDAKAEVETCGADGEVLPRSLLDGVGEAVCATLGIRHLDHVSALVELSKRPDLPRGSIPVAYALIAQNWRRCSAAGVSSQSRENWRWRQPVLGIAPSNKSPEVVLERALAAALAVHRSGKWWVQMPMVSGVAGPRADRRRAIDLVHAVDDRHIELIELKVPSNTPLLAAFEIIFNALLWLQCRAAAGEGASPLLAADRVDARVLAPAAYYARYDLKALQHLLDDEIRELGAAHCVALSFGFDVLPDRLLDRSLDQAEMCTLLDARRPL